MGKMQCIALKRCLNLSCNSPYYTEILLNIHVLFGPYLAIKHTYFMSIMELIIAGIMGDYCGKLTMDLLSNVY